jgi:GxxExxY protein
MLKEDELSNEIIGAAIEVHRGLGPGLLESAYEECLCYEFDAREIRYERQKPLPVAYKGKKLDCGYRLDMVVNDLVILELKAVDQILPIHNAQVLTYLKLSGLKLGMLINFNVTVLKNGIKRIVNEL